MIYIVPRGIYSGTYNTLFDQEFMRSIIFNLVFLKNDLRIYATEAMEEFVKQLNLFSR